MKSESKAFWGSASVHGVILGMVLIIIQLVLWMTNYIPVGFGAYIPIAGNMLIIYPAALIISGIVYRITVCSGSISYGKAFVFGLAVFGFAVVTLAVFNYVFLKFIDPEYTMRVGQANMDWTEKFLRRTMAGADEELIEKSMERSIKQAEKALNMKPWVSALATLSKAFGGAIVLTVTSAIVKKESKDPFRDVM